MHGKKNRRVKAKGGGRRKERREGGQKGRGREGNNVYIDSLYNNQGPGLVVACNELELQSQSGTEFIGLI